MTNHFIDNNSRYVVQAGCRRFQFDSQKQGFDYEAEVVVFFYVVHINNLKNMFQYFKVTRKVLSHQKSQIQNKNKGKTTKERETNSRRNCPAQGSILSCTRKRALTPERVPTMSTLSPTNWLERLAPTPPGSLSRMSKTAWTACLNRLSRQWPPWCIGTIARTILFLLWGFFFQIYVIFNLVCFIFFNKVTKWQNMMTISKLVIDSQKIRERTDDRTGLSSKNKRCPLQLEDCI